jgi:hypothetical protein
VPASTPSSELGPRLHSTDIAFKPTTDGWGYSHVYGSGWDNIFKKKGKVQEPPPPSPPALAEKLTPGAGPSMGALGRSLTHGVDALRHASAHLDLGVADRAVQALLECTGRRYFTGIGKSGHAAARMASSLSSIGLAAHWVHGAEWSHGELGALSAGDLVFAVSQSGSTQGDRARRALARTLTLALPPWP